MRRVAAFGLALPLMQLMAVSAGAQTKRPLRPEDLLAVKDIVDVQLAPDGREVLYVVKEADLKAGQYVQTIWRVSTDGAKSPVRLPTSAKDTAPQWLPDSRKVSFLSPRDGHAQVCLLGLESGSEEQLTQAPAGVISFQWAPNGKQIAFVAADQERGAFEQALGNQETGVIVNKWDFPIYKLLRNQLFLDLEKPSSLWLVDVPSKNLTRVTTGISVSSFQWSPDSRSLAIAARPVPGFSDQRSDILLYSVEKRTLTTILRGEGGGDWSHSKSYSNPIWSPDGKRLAVFYRDQKDRWASLARIGIFSIEDLSFSLITAEDKLELYTSEMRWIRKDEIYLENTERASRHLFLISVKDGSEYPMGNQDFYESHFSFSNGGRQIAFVRQSFKNPPEIYVSQEGTTAQPRKLTSINGDFAAFELPDCERVQWKAPDGTQVEGWLVKPPGFHETKTYPLIVMVHGGPGYVVPNGFHLYDAWPYPFRIYALRGYLVLLPNYRGTGSYGKAFLQPHDIAKDPSDDILSGISFLANRGIVDGERIGIMGQSHGAWLGPYVMAKQRIFRAASFAEGSVDILSIYGHMPGWLNLNVHEYYYGSTPYDDPQRYLELSPIFNFKGLRTATLLEFGEQSLAVDGLEFLTALWRQGIPHEFVIYPKTGHNISSPRLELESMNRNLDWFDFWMLDKQDPDPKKQSQYERWKQMTVEMEKMRLRTPQTQPMR